MNKNLFLIHGAWCTANSFNYLTKKILDDTPVGRIHHFEYDCQKETIDKIYSRAEKDLAKISKNGPETIIVGHSMGGLVALKLSQKDCVRNTVTLASPIAGIRFSYFLQTYLSYYAPILREITPDSPFVKHLHSMTYESKPTTALVAAKGFSPFIIEPNDGVITIASQIEWKPDNMKFMEIDSNHNEILQNPKTLLMIESLLR